MGVITVTEAELGQSVAKDQVLKGLTLKIPPSAAGYGNYFTLTDGEMVLYNIDPSTSHISSDSVLFSGGYGFGDLILKNIPVGSTFELDVTAPPTLGSLSPNSVESGAPDLTLSCTGTDFTGGSIIMFGSEDEPTTMVSDTELTTIVKPSLFAPATVPVTVRTGRFTTDPVDFTFTEPAAKEA
jgi:hypothetical protein